MLTIDIARAGVRPGSTVLDVGCGSGRHAFACLKVGADTLAMDRDADELAGLAAMVRAMRDAGEVTGARDALLVGDARALPLPDASVDVVIASEVLEHIPADDEAIAELARVLRDGGIAAFSVPRAGPEAVNWMLSRRYHTAEGGHIRIYRRSVLLRRLRAAGLEPNGTCHRHALHSPYWWLRCLVGVDNDDNPLVRAYHRMLVWDIVRRPWITRVAERILDPLIGKSLVVYATRVAR